MMNLPILKVSFTIVSILASLMCFAEETEAIPEQTNVQFRLTGEYAETGGNKYYLLGWSQGTVQAPETARNTGYLGLDYRTWNGWTLATLGLRVDNFHLYTKPSQGGMKFGVYLYQETGQTNIGLPALDSKHDRVGFGLTVKPVFQPVKGVFINGGVSVRPFFTSFDWDEPYLLINEVQLGIDWFLGNNFAITGQFTSITGFSNFTPENLNTGIWSGFRFQF